MKQLYLFVFLFVTIINSKSNPPTVKNSIGTIAENAIIIHDNEVMDIVIKVSAQDVVVMGNNNNIVINGLCNKLMITGKGNDVEVDTTTNIIITGNYNFVSWKNTTNKNDQASIKDSGSYNNIGKRSADAIKK
jgi:hypothetical protein